MTDARVGLRYRIRGTNREGMVTEVHGAIAMWAEFVAGWPYPNAPVAQFVAELERAPMRDARGEPVTILEAHKPTGRPQPELPSSRHLAVELGSIRYFTGEKCPNGHIAARYTLSAYCVECQRLKTLAQKAAVKMKRGIR